MQHDEHALKIWIDGSSYPSLGRNNGLAGVIQYPDAWDLPLKEAFQEAYDSSNIARMELMACVRALEYVRAHIEEWRSQGVRRIQIITDNQYVQRNQGNVPRWIRNKWRGAEGQPIANRDLWRRILSLRRVVPVEIEWNPGKTNEYNKAVDKLAKAAAKAPVKRKDAGFRPGKIARSPVGPGPALPYPANGDSVVIRTHRYVPTDTLLGERKVIFSVREPTTGELKGKFFAFNRGGDVSRKGLMKATFGSNPKYPVIDILEPLEESAV